MTRLIWSTVWISASPLPLYILDQLGIITRGHFKLVDRVAVPDDAGVTDLDDSGVADLESPDDSVCSPVKDRKTPEKLVGIKSYRGEDKKSNKQKYCLCM